MFPREVQKHYMVKIRLLQNVTARLKSVSFCLQDICGGRFPPLLHIALIKSLYHPSCVPVFI